MAFPSSTRMYEQGPVNPPVEECWAHLLGAQQILTERLLQELLYGCQLFQFQLYLFFHELPASHAVTCTK